MTITTAIRQSTARMSTPQKLARHPRCCCANVAAGSPTSCVKPGTSPETITSVVFMLNTVAPSTKIANGMSSFLSRDQSGEGFQRSGDHVEQRRFVVGRPGEHTKSVVGAHHEPRGDHRI